MRSTGSVQTPPPTTTSASKRKAKQAQVAKLVKKSASGARKLSSTSFTQQTFPQQNHDLLQESPQFFPTLQFSPDVFAFPSAGPATAPIYPHQKLFWDPDTSMGPVDMDFSGGGLDLFNSNPPFEIDTFMTTQSTIQPVPATSKSGFGSDGQGFMAHNPAANLLPTTTSAIELSSYRSSTAQISTQEFDVNSNALEHAVDPNLLLSTSDLQHPPIRLDNSTGKLAGEVRQPYLHQMQESRREKELERVRKVKSKHHPHPPVAQLAKRTSASNQEKRPRLERRSTDTIVRKASGHASKQSQEPLREPSRHVKRRHPELFHKRSSPVKSQPTETRDIILGEPKSEHPARVTFTIDNNGRARTEATMKAGGSESETDQDTQVTGSRAWENSDSETSEDADADFTTSFRSSFTFPTSKQPKLARFSTDSISHSKKSSYSSTYASSRSEQTVGDSELGSRPHSGHLIASASNKFSGIQKARGTSSMSSGTLSDPSAIIADEPGSEADTVVDSDHANGDAQHALKKVLKDRARKKRIGRSLPTSSKAREKPHHQDFPPTKHQTHSSRYQPTVITPTQDQHSRVYGTTYNLSPTTITDPDLTSPSTDRGSSIGDSTRCVCHSSESGGHLMIQW
ncbi:hypothetical protein MMC16_001096 [Acarospora aff. strigata]|nr:hypothetical protein [Acarospora aff. strigata]